MNKYYGNFLLKKQILVRDLPCDRIVWQYGVNAKLFF